MDFARVLDLLDGYFSRTSQPFAVIGALGIAAWGVGRTTFDVDEAEIRAHFKKYGMEDLLERLDR